MKNPAASFELTERDYINFRNFIYEKSGINLHNGKRELLKARLAKYLRHSDFRSFEDYYRFLVKHDEGGEECIHLLDSISTNLTYFFREPAHYDFLIETALPELAPLFKSRRQKRIDLWSAGCSSGEEPYSLGITLLEHFGREGECGLRILATDISTKMLKKASEGIYPAEKLEKIPYDVKRKYFMKGMNGWRGFYRVKPILRELVAFERLNLVEAFPSDYAFDVIFCRNVMIYFDKPTQEKIVDKFHRALRPKGYLFIGHAESLTGIHHAFRYIRPSVYVK